MPTAKQKALDRFASEATKKEGGRSSAKLHHTRELMKIMNEMLGGALYPAIELWAKAQKEG